MQRLFKTTRVVMHSCFYEVLESSWSAHFISRARVLNTGIMRSAIITILLLYARVVFCASGALYCRCSGASATSDALMPKVQGTRVPKGTPVHLQG